MYNNNIHSPTTNDIHSHAWPHLIITMTSLNQKTKMWSPVSETGGYDYRFVEEPLDSLKCLICLLVARDPQQHGGCGKLFCQSCIAAHRVLRNDCPHCRQPLSNSQQTTIFNDFKSKYSNLPCKLKLSQSTILGLGSLPIYWEGYRLFLYTVLKGLLFTT